MPETWKPDITTTALTKLYIIKLQGSQKTQHTVMDGWIIK